MNSKVIDAFAKIIIKIENLPALDAYSYRGTSSRYVIRKQLKAFAALKATSHLFLWHCTMDMIMLKVTIIRKMANAMRISL